jgi:hypothetical protein
VVQVDTRGGSGDVDVEEVLNNEGEGLATGTKRKKHSTAPPAIVQFWRIMSGWELPNPAAETMAKDQFGEWLKLSHVLLVMVGGSVEDERLFSQMNYVKNRLRSKLLLYLPALLALESSEDVHNLHVSV